MERNTETVPGVVIEDAPITDRNTTVILTVTTMLIELLSSNTPNYSCNNMRNTVIASYYKYLGR